MYSSLIKRKDANTFAILERLEELLPPIGPQGDPESDVKLNRLWDLDEKLSDKMNKLMKLSAPSAKDRNRLKAQLKMVSKYSGTPLRKKKVAKKSIWNKFYNATLSGGQRRRGSRSQRRSK